MIHSMIAGRAHERCFRLLSGPVPDMTDALPTGETALWRAVIARALQDASFGLHGAKSRRKPRRPSAASRRHALAAREWLLGNSGFFSRVCLLAGLDPGLVRASAAIAIASCDRTLREQESPAGGKIGSFLAHNQCGQNQPGTSSV